MNIHSMNMTLIKTVLAAAAMLALAIPAIGFAASYAYVDQSGNVRSVTADSASAAIMTAPNIGTHSGVILLDSADDNALVGDSVSGA